MKIYTFSGLQKVLKKKGLPYSKPTIQKYENTGIIPVPKRLTFMKRSDRIYEQEQVDEIVEKIKAHLK